MDDTVPAQALRESEELHRITLLNMSDAVFITNADGVFTFICPNVDVIFGYDQDEVRAMDRIARLLGAELIDPAQLAAQGELRNIEHQIVTKGGTLRSLLVHVKQVAIKGGTILYVCRDITERKESEKELHELSGRLINAHEQERIRLSRELHDDVAQRLTLLAAQLGVLRHRLEQAPSDIQDHVAKLAAQTVEIGSELHRLSHELHPARLQVVGLEASVRGFCEELAAAREIGIDVRIAELPQPLSPDLTLCIYRIVQEALHNVVKHSGASRASVTLTNEAGHIVLSVVDDGVGFSTVAVRKKDTLGLVSMRERARLAGGQLAVTSMPGHGTQVEVRMQPQTA
jgi:PAS domain S-box-containing protein